LKVQLLIKQVKLKRQIYAVVRKENMPFLDHLSIVMVYHTQLNK